MAPNLPIYLTLQVVEGRGYASSQDIFLAVSPVFARQRLMSQFLCSNLSFMHRFSWPIKRLNELRLLTSGAEIRIEVWERKDEDHFYIGHAIMQIDQAEHSYEDDELKYRYLKLTNEFSDSPNTRCGILTTLNIQHTQPKCCCVKAYTLAELPWLNYRPAQFCKSLHETMGTSKQSLNSSTSNKVSTSFDCQNESSKEANAEPLILQYLNLNVKSIDVDEDSSEDDRPYSIDCDDGGTSVRVLLDLDSNNVCNGECDEQTVDEDDRSRIQSIPARTLKDIKELYSTANHQEHPNTSSTRTTSTQTTFTQTTYTQTTSTQTISTVTRPLSSTREDEHDEVAQHHYTYILNLVIESVTWHTELTEKRVSVRLYNPFDRSTAVVLESERPCLIEGHLKTIIGRFYYISKRRCLSKDISGFRPTIVITKPNIDHPITIGILDEKVTIVGPEQKLCRGSITLTTENEETIATLLVFFIIVKADVGRTPLYTRTKFILKSSNDDDDHDETTTEATSSTDEEVLERKKITVTTSLPKNMYI